MDEALSPLTLANIARAGHRTALIRAWEELAPELPGHQPQLAREAARVLRVAPPERTTEGERDFLVRAGFSAALLDDVMVGRLMRVVDGEAAAIESTAEFVRGQPALAMAQALYAEARRPERASFAQAVRGYFLSPMLNPPIELSRGLEEAARVTLDTLAEFAPAYVVTLRATLHVTRLVDWSIPRLCAVDPTPPQDPLELVREARRAWDTDARRPLLELLRDDDLALAIAWTDGRVTIDAEGVHIDTPRDRAKAVVVHHVYPFIAHLELASRQIGIALALELDPRPTEEG